MEAKILLIMLDFRENNRFNYLFGSYFMFCPYVKKLDVILSINTLLNFNSMLILMLGVS